MTSPVGIYIHVPYCRVACPYCDFVKRPTPGDAPEEFADALCREIAEYAGPTDARSIFFGGGTPSLLSARAFERIFRALKEKFRVAAVSEICIEVNPDDVTRDRARFWRDLGVNRLSLGVQSFDDEVLKFLGRCHDADHARRACDLVGETFGNWGIDLIFGAKPAEAWAASVSECIRFASPHVSTYGLTYEEHTAFWNQRHTAISEDVALAQYRHAMDTLGAAGYLHYEVSNFAKPGYESAHNLIYWRNEEYAAFGPGAVSYLGGIRARNLPNIAAYLARPGAKEESLTLAPREVRVETLIQHFRTRVGIARVAYRARFGSAIEDDFGPAIRALVNSGLLADDGERLSPTRRGYELNNEIGLALV
jgi:oxygen-independent coproporphyrinogen-3 oxidase